MFPLKIPGSSVVKSTAKAFLEGNRLLAAAASTVPYISYLFVALLLGCFALLPGDNMIILSLLFAVVGIFLLFPVFLGAIRWFWRFTEGVRDGVGEVFFYFETLARYKRAVKCALALILKIFTAFFTCLLPYFVVAILSNSWIYQFLGTEIPMWVAGLAFVQAFLRVVGVISALTVISRYYLFPAIVVMDDGVLLLEALHISVMVSRHSVSAFIGLFFSLILYVLLALTVAGVPLAAPMLFCCYAVHSRYALVNYNQSLDFYNKEQYAKDYL